MCVFALVGGGGGGVKGGNPEILIQKRVKFTYFTSGNKICCSISAGASSSSSKSSLKL